MRVALYARVSTKASSKRKMADGKERERQDPEVQLVKLRKYAMEHGWEVHKEYVDRASGKNQHRPALEDLMNDAKGRKFEKIIIVRLDRMMRSVINFANIVQELNSLTPPVGIKCTDQEIDTSASNPYSRLLQNLLMSISEFEREIIGERSRDGFLKAIEDGKQIGRPNKTGLNEQIVFEALRGRSLDDAAEVLKVKESSLRYYVRKMGGLSAIRQKQGVNKEGVESSYTNPGKSGECQKEVELTLPAESETDSLPAR